MLINPKNVFLKKLKNSSIIVTVLCLFVGGYSLSKKYKKIEIEQNSNIRQQLFDSLFCCDWTGDRDERIRNEISDKWMNAEISEETIDNWIRFGLSKMGRMDKGLYNYYFKTTDREIVKQEIIEYKIKSEQKVILEKYKQYDDSLSDARLNFIDIESEKRMNTVNVLGLFPFAYLIGSFFGILILPIIFWSTWYYFKRRTFQ